MVSRLSCARFFGWGARALLAFVVAANVSCKASSSGSSQAAPTTVQPAIRQPPASTWLSPATKTIRVEVDYVAGAEPYVGSAGVLPSVWKLFRANVAGVVDQRKTVETPTTLSAMEKIDDVTVTEFTDEDLVAVANAHRNEASEDGLVTFYVVFVNGVYKDAEGNVRDDVVSTSVGKTGIVGVFKPAIRTLEGLKEPLAQYVEQLAVIHGFGHAVGFVENGIPVNTPHHDAEQGAHCTDERCVMKAAVETVAGAKAFAAKYLTKPDVVVYGQECLSDARILENKLQ